MLSFKAFREFREIGSASIEVALEQNAKGVID